MKEHIIKAIEHLRQAIDIDPDKTDQIRRENDAIYGMISMLKIIIKEVEY